MLKALIIDEDQGFTVKVACMDCEFEYLRPDLNGIYLNTSIMSEHIPQTEWKNRAIKDIMRVIWSTFTFKTPPGGFLLKSFTLWYYG